MEIKDFYAPLLRWWQLILASVVIAGAFSLFAVMQQDPIYRTQATLMIGSAIEEANPDYSTFYFSQQLARTYANLATRQPVRDATMKALGLTWLPSYTVSSVPSTELLQIVVQDNDPVRAQAVANEVANQLILSSPTNQAQTQSRQEFINERMDTLEVKIKDTEGEIDALQQELNNLTSARQIADLEKQILDAQTKLDTLNNSYTSLLANTSQGAKNTLSLIEPAPLPGSPVGPNKMMIVLTSVVAAFVLAAGAAYLLAFLDTTIKSPEEIKALTNYATLAAIPFIGSENMEERLITLREPRSPISEAYRVLRTGVQFSTIDRQECIAIEVTSPNPSEGKSLTIVNLAIVIAQTGMRVLLIDADLRRPVINKYFGTDNRFGFTDLFRDQRIQHFDETFNTLLFEYIRKTPVEGLSLLTSGPIPPNPSELLGSNRHQRLLGALRECFDYILMDSPPVLIVTDAMVLSNIVDGTILVIDAESTPKNHLKLAAERFQEVNANVLGVVVNRLKPKQNGFGAYSASYEKYEKYGRSSFGYSVLNEPAEKRWKLPRLIKKRP